MAITRKEDKHITGSCAITALLKVITAKQPNLAQAQSAPALKVNKRPPIHQITVLKADGLAPTKALTIHQPLKLNQTPPLKAKIPRIIQQTTLG
jgi:hypothetical protein